MCSALCRDVCFLCSVGSLTALKFCLLRETMPHSWVMHVRSYGCVNWQLLWREKWSLLHSQLHVAMKSFHCRVCCPTLFNSNFKVRIRKRRESKKRVGKLHCLTFHSNNKNVWHKHKMYNFTVYTYTFTLFGAVFFILFTLRASLVLLCPERSFLSNRNLYLNCRQSLGFLLSLENTCMQLNINIFLPRVTWEGRYHLHICMHYIFLA